MIAIVRACSTVLTSPKGITCSVHVHLCMPIKPKYDVAYELESYILKSIMIMIIVMIIIITIIRSIIIIIIIIITIIITINNNDNDNGYDHDRYDT